MVKILIIFSSLLIILDSSEAGQNNGTYTDISKYPYLVAIQIPKVRICTGAIISQFVIMTSATCIVDAPDTKSIKIRAGSTRRQTGGLPLRPLKTEIYPLYENKWGSDFNIALIYLPVPITPSETIQVAQIPDECEEFDDNFRVVGWAPMENSSFYSKELKFYDQTLVNETICSTVYNFKKKLNSARTFCGMSTDLENVCKGHGMMVVSATNKIVGIYGWRSNCTTMNYPEIYTKVATYRSWIRAITGI